MHTMLRSLTAAAASVLIASAAFAAPAPGHVDFGQFTPAAGQQFVDIEVDGGLLKLAAIFAGKEDPEIGKLVANLQRVRVNVLGLSDETRASTTQRIRQIREGLSAQGWKRVVTVQERNGEDVGVYLKQAADDAIEGIVVTVISGGNEAVLINVVGNVKLEQIATVGERLNIEPLRKLNLASR
jgi:hypothetical protein